jgi:predicted GNAT superfamily acetyltransferase
VRCFNSPVASVSDQQLSIRKCAGVDEFQQCVELQKEVWGFADLDVIPLRMFVVADKIGGQIIGAFNNNEVVGFALAIPGARNGNSYLHSHMLAVRESYRNAGLGRRLKLAQRQDGLARGFDLIEWTFDPLEIKNAHLNIVRLGAIARRYNINQYGMSSSPLQGGLPTDRLIAEWWLRSRRVQALMESGALPEYKIETRIEVPAAVYQWKASPVDRDRARDVQSRNREAFLNAFTSGLAVLGYDRNSAGDGTFLLGRWDEELSYAS